MSDFSATCDTLNEACDSCGEDSSDSCVSSQRPCGHHCNHSWSHERCCWCGQEWGDDEDDDV